MKRVRRWWGLGLAVGLCVVCGVAFNQTASSVPLVQLPGSPLFLNGVKAKANLVLALSVETPTVGSAYYGAFDPSKPLTGYFDPQFCYRNRTDDTARGEYFAAATLKPSIDADCGSLGYFDGNFLNWATASAIDMVRYGLTGGNRVVDEGTGVTVLERAYLPAGFYTSSFFPRKVLPASQIALRTPFASAGIPGNLHIVNCLNRVYFAKQDDPTGRCEDPFGVPNATSDQLIRPGAGASDARFFTMRVLACDNRTAGNRLMLYDASTRRWSGLCLRYRSTSGATFYKPVGQIQVNADNVRVSVFSYLVTGNGETYGGVMRAPLKYTGTRRYDVNANLIDDSNPHREWDPVTGVLLRNPQFGHADYGDQGYPQSGAINYINGFGTLNPERKGVYKDWDPLGELYYEAFRYLQGRAPTPLAFAGLRGSRATDKTLTEDFPAYFTWTDPLAGFIDTPQPGRSCARSSIIALGDPHTHHDRFLPGNNWKYGEDGPRLASTDPDLDTVHWTRLLGWQEPELKRNFIEVSLFTDTGATGSYLMAGLAYFGNTRTFRNDLPKARIKTFSIDVNSYNSSGAGADAARRRTPLYLAAKYGGFDDLDGSGSPYQGTPGAPGPNDTAWQDPTDGDARNYFLASDPQKLQDALADVFASQVQETHGLTGATSSSTLVASGGAAVFQASFVPLANYWSGRVRKLPLALGADGRSTTVASPAWEAARVLTDRVARDNGDDRRIFVGPPIGRQGVQAPTAFTWAALANEHRVAFDRMFNGQRSKRGFQRVPYLRGDRTEEQKPERSTGTFRARDMVLGSITNAGLVYQGAPNPDLTGAGYASFRQAKADRTAVVFAAANDGMLHAFRDSDGHEAFAYVPGFVVPFMHTLPEVEYVHRPLLDATPVVGEAFAHGEWRSVLVGGAGGGAQGVYALDVTDPDTFDASKVLWEFTDADDPAMGNVMGRPHIARLRTSPAGSGTPTYKWVAVVASGINNQQPDGRAQSDATPSIFLLDLEARPSPTNPWREGVNYWRIDLPQASDAMATGVVEMTTIKQAGTGTLNTLLAGDLQGNVWKLDFASTDLQTLGTAADRLAAVNAVGGHHPMFVATDSDGRRQPITSAPLLASGAGGKRVVIVGTGKFLEAVDGSVPVQPGNTLYAIPDTSTPSAGRTTFKPVSLDAATRQLSSTITVRDGSQGWYLDLSAPLGERQVSPMLLERGRLLLNSLMPAADACSDGGGRAYEIDVLSGQGGFLDSDVGLLGAPFLVERNAATVSASDSSGRRQVTYHLDVGAQGSKGVSVRNAANTITLQVGRMSWRQVHRENP